MSTRISNARAEPGFHVNNVPFPFSVWRLVCSAHSADSTGSPPKTSHKPSFPKPSPPKPHLPKSALPKLSLPTLPYRNSQLPNLHFTNHSHTNHPFTKPSPPKPSLSKYSILISRCSLSGFLISVQVTDLERQERRILKKEQ